MNRREMVYQPMGQKPLVPESRMAEILAKHKLRTAGEAPKAQTDVKQTDGRNDQSAALLAWQPKAEGAHYIADSTGRYTVSGAKSQGKLRYSAWKRSVVPGAMPEPLGCRDNLDEAKQLCEAHLASEAK